VGSVRSEIAGRQRHLGDRRTGRQYPEAAPLVLASRHRVADVPIRAWIGDPETGWSIGTAHHSPIRIIGEWDIEAVVAVLLDQVIAGPERVQRRGIALRNTKGIAHCADTEIVFEGIAGLVARLQVVKVVDDACAHVVADREPIGVMHGYAVIVAVVDAVAVDQGIRSGMTDLVKVNRVAAELILAELLQLGPLISTFL
jgi:hypothetical protein